MVIEQLPPPLPITADVLTLSKLVDGILFVSRPGVVDQEGATLAKETLATSGKPILGMVINSVRDLRGNKLPGNLINEATRKRSLWLGC